MNKQSIIRVYCFIIMMATCLVCSTIGAMLNLGIISISEKLGVVFLAVIITIAVTIYPIALINEMKDKESLGESE